jgi:hypothetical protein
MAKADMDFQAPLNLPEGVPADEAAIIRATYSYRQEAYIAKRDRMIQNRINWDTYNLKADWSHKKRGQSREFLPKQALAVEQISSFFHQAMIDAGEWFAIERAPGLANSKIKPHELKVLLQKQLDKVRFDEKVVDALKMGLVGSLCIMKVHGEYVKRPIFYTEKQMDKDDSIRSVLYRSDKRAWQLKIDLVRQEDIFPDPTGDGLFVIQQIEMDYHKLKELSQGPNAIYDPEVVNQITGGFEDMEQVARKARETAQNQTYTTYRKRVRLWECWGTIINPSTGDVIARDVTWTVANDRYLIQKPQPYPFWHGSHPFVVAPIVRTPNSVWHKALMDAPTQLNVALNEAFNLALDAGIMAAFGISQLRTDWLADETKVADGIAPGDTLEVNTLCPPGAKVLEPVQTGTLSPEFLQIYNLTNAEFSTAAITNDIRMGVLPARAVKATEVVEASQTITSMFTGLAKVLEQNLIVPTLEKAWATIAQNADDFDMEEFKALIGEDRALKIAGMAPEERFKETAQGYKFKVYGVSMILNRMKDYKKLTSLLQTIGGVQPLTEEYIKKYDFGKLLEEIMKSLDIDPAKLEVPQEEQAAMQGQQGGGAGAAPAGPDVMSQTPQAAGMSNDFGSAGGPQPAAGSAMPSTSFPPSRATPA